MDRIAQGDTFDQRTFRRCIQVCLILSGAFGFAPGPAVFNGN